MLTSTTSTLIKIEVYVVILFSSFFALSGCLVTDDTRFKNFWQLSHYLDIAVSLHDKFHIAPVRKKYQSLMESFARLGLGAKQFESLNSVWKYKEVVHFSDIFCCDGATVDRDILLREEGLSVGHKFPTECLSPPTFSCGSITFSPSHIHCIPFIIP